MEAGRGERAEGEGDARQKRTAARAGHPSVEERGKRAATKHRERKMGGERKKKGDGGDAKRDGDVEKSRRKRETTRP